ncbi:response regulator transcription factor [Treponema sp.]|uniref:response regulator transcription factor n=1 Tax=Treponema sp. TaxID=166 RepID=UPI00298DE63A|nr:response regulator transcription factor [Treponema sp.]MCQ2240119.1 response regulator transcription factor [Treponema sp.]
MKKLILIDDHAMLREGIASWLTKNSDCEIILQCENFEKLQSAFEKSNFSTEDTIIAIVDLSYKTENCKIESETGWEIIKWLNTKNIPSIVFSSHDTGTFIEKAMGPDIRARGFVSKTSDEKVLLDAINMVAAGKTYIQPDLFSGFIETKSILSALSSKEQEIADLIMHNFENEEIAEKLNLKLHTVENYISKIYDKTGTNSKKGLIELLL